MIKESEDLIGFGAFINKSEIDGFRSCSVSLGDVAGNEKVELAFGVDVNTRGFLGVIIDCF